MIVLNSLCGFCQVFLPKYLSQSSIPAAHKAIPFSELLPPWTRLEKYISFHINPICPDVSPKAINNGRVLVISTIGRDPTPASTHKDCNCRAAAAEAISQLCDQDYYRPPGSCLFEQRTKTKHQDSKNQYYPKPEMHRPLSIVDLGRSGNSHVDLLQIPASVQ